MIFLIISFFVPVVIWIFLPWVMYTVSAKKFERDWILFIACICFFISWYLPSPLIHGVDTNFTTHVVGGGVFSGLLWIYLKKQLQWKFSWMIELITAFGLVSTLGVMNELFELFTVELHLTKLTGTDTWWDLLANTLGTLIVWLSYSVITHLKNSNRSNSISK
ncbi:MAG: hypothetical protein WCK01_01505 [Candidatus Uhrbacteria bacterium]